MEKKMENEMETGIIGYFFSFMNICRLVGPPLPSAFPFGAKLGPCIGTFLKSGTSGTLGNMCTAANGKSEVPPSPRSYIESSLEKTTCTLNDKCVQDLRVKPLVRRCGVGFRL